LSKSGIRAALTVTVKRNVLKLEASHSECAARRCLQPFCSRNRLGDCCRDRRWDGCSGH